MTDPVTNALAIQLEYGEDELKAQIEARLREVAFATAENVATQIAKQVATNLVDRYITEQAVSHINTLFDQRVRVLTEQVIKEQLQVFLSDYKFNEAVRNISRQTAQQLELDALAVRTGRQFY